MRSEMLSKKAIKRCQRAVSMRMIGMTYKEIGGAMGVSGSRASGIVKEGEEYQRMGIDALLSVRARNITMAVVGRVGGIYPTPYWIEAEQYIPLNFLMISGCGRTTLREIIAWMHDADCWLEFNKNGAHK